MKITVKNEGKVYTLVIEGRIDTLTAPELGKDFNDNAEKADKMIFDMYGVDYISSAGIRAIVSAYKAMGSKDGLVLKGLRNNVLTIIRMTGLEKKLTIEE